MMLSTPTSSIAEDLIARIGKCADEIEAGAEQNEHAGRLTKDTMDALQASGVLDAMVPAECGGADLTLYDVLRVYEALSYVDTSAAWVAMIPGVQGKALLLLDESARSKLTAPGYPFVAGQGAPTGIATPASGGYHVSGRWSYGSALLHCDTATGMATVVDNDHPVLDEAGDPVAIIFFTPVTNVKVEGNWDTLGMRATGSVDYSMSNVFVPFEHTAQKPFTTPLGGQGHAKLVGFTAWTMSVHCAVPLGTGRRLLDEIAAFARQPRRRGLRLADDPRFTHDYGKAEAAYRSARAFMYEAFGAAQQRVNLGDAVTRRDLTDMRAASVLLHDVNVGNATFAVRESGGLGLRAGRLQRLYRDIVAMGQHIQVSQPTWGECAKDYLGEAEGLQWALNQLV
ncbi:hypothetical protein A9W96_26535 [Mycobacterium sp. 1245852.3]|nr:hypothetical protein A9W96_26535 [Mycobacterium sp. 1245852.3]